MTDMGLETGTWVDDLISTNPIGGTDPFSEGDDHLRLIKSVLKNTFPNATKALTATMDAVNLASVQRATYGGTANAITLTTGMSLPSVPTGAMLRFRATAPNTGATTINVDGIGLVNAVTVTGVALPSGYVRTDMDTVIIKEATTYVVYRDAEKSSNANGGFVRYANGVMDCSANITYDAGSEVTGYRGSWTFPAAFTATPSFSHYLAEVSGPSGDGEGFIFGDTADTQNGTVSGFFVRKYAGFMRTMRVRHLAKGDWY